MAEAQATQEQSFEPTFKAGDRFSRYEVVRFVGRGAMSEVYEATHLDLEKAVALKLLRNERVDNATARARFLREGRAAARLRHPGVVEIFDVGEQEGRPFLVMELLEGRSLEQHISEQGNLSPEQAIQLILPIAAAVQVAHDAGVLHRDLKPENIFLTQDGPRRIRPKIVDFGISSFLGQDVSKLTMETDILGTPQYMAPEQARGETLDGRADQYSLGVILFELLTGRLPHERGSLVDLLHAVAYEPGESIKTIAPEMPDGLAEVVDRSLSHKLEDRFDSVREFALAVVQHASDEARTFWQEELKSREASTVQTESKIEKSPFVITLTSTRPSKVRPVGIETQSSNNRGVILIGGAILVALLIAMGGYTLSRGGGATEAPEPAATSPQTAEIATSIDVDMTTVPEAARILLDGEEVGLGEFVRTLEPRAGGYELSVEAEGYQPRTFQFDQQPPPRIVVLSRDGVDDMPEPLPTEVTPSMRRVVGARPRTPLQRRQPTPSAPVSPEPEEPVAEAEPPSAMVEMTPMTAPTPTLTNSPRVTSMNRLTDNLDPWR